MICLLLMAYRSENKTVDLTSFPIRLDPDSDQWPRTSWHTIPRVHAMTDHIISTTSSVPV